MRLRLDVVFQTSLTAKIAEKEGSELSAKLMQFTYDCQIGFFKTLSPSSIKQSLSVKAYEK